MFTCDLSSAGGAHCSQLHNKIFWNDSRLSNPSAPPHLERQAICASTKTLTIPPHPGMDAMLQIMQQRPVYAYVQVSKEIAQRRRNTTGVPEKGCHLRNRQPWPGDVPRKQVDFCLFYCKPLASFDISARRCPPCLLPDKV